MEEARSFSPRPVRLEFVAERMADEMLALAFALVTDVEPEVLRRRHSVQSREVERDFHAARLQEVLQ